MKFWLLFSLLLQFGFPALAEEASLLKTKDKTALDFERVVVEENLKSKILGVVLPLVPEKRFNLNVTINYKIHKAKPESEPGQESERGVELGKLGVVAPSLSEELLHQDLINNIGFIRITFIFYDFIDPELADHLTRTVKKIVDIVPVWRLRIEMVIPPAPAAPVVEKPSSKFQIPGLQMWFGFGLLLIVAVGMFFAYIKLRNDVLIVGETLKEMRSSKADTQPVSTYVEVTQAPEDPETVTVFEVRKEESSEEPDQEQDHAQPVSSGIIPIAAVNQAMEFLAMSSPASEDHIFNALARAGRVDILQDAASTYFPASLVFELPTEILTRAFGMLDIREKTGLMITLTEESRRLLLSSMSETGKAFFEHELQRLAADPSAKQEAEAGYDLYWKQFVDVVRQLLRSQEEPSREAQALIKNWVNEKIRMVRRAG